MFPNVRLMIAAVAASVVALSCGFGVFAAFRVNHEPLARLQSVPLQLVVGNAAPQSLRLAAIASDEHAARPSAPPAALTPAAEDQPAAARAAKAETAPSAAEGELMSARDMHDAASQDASSQATLRQQQPPQAGDRATPISAAKASMELAPTAAPSAAAIEPPRHQAPPVEQVKRDSEAPPALAPSEAATAAHVAPQPAAEKPKRTRTAGTRRSRRARPGALAAAGAQSFAFAQPQFQTAPQSYLAPLRQRLVRVKVSARKNAKRHSAVGGPFVGAQPSEAPPQP